RPPRRSPTCSGSTGSRPLRRASARSALLRERRAEQREHPAPGLLRLLAVVDPRIDRAPAVDGAGIDLDLGGELRFRERFAKNRLSFGLALVVALGDGDEIGRLHFRHEEMRALGLVGY